MSQPGRGKSDANSMEIFLALHLARAGFTVLTRGIASEDLDELDASGTFILSEPADIAFSGKRRNGFIPLKPWFGTAT